jgi:hypothetical protein
MVAELGAMTPAGRAFPRKRLVTLRIFDMVLDGFYFGRVKVLLHGRVRCVSYEEKGIWVYLVTGSALKLVACRRGL